MDAIITEYPKGVSRVELNRPTKKNAMTLSMYVAFAEILNEASRDERARVVRVCGREHEIPNAIHQSCPGAGFLVELLGPSEDRPYSRGELILLGLPFNARRAADLGFVTQVVSDQNLVTTATATARKFAEKSAGALEASKKLMKRSFRGQIEAAMRA